MSKTNNLLHIVDFKTEQIIGVIKEQDYWDDLRQWELKDNKDKFEFTTADGTKIAASLIQQNLVVKQTRDGTFVSYIITEVEQDTTGRPKKIYALGEHTKLKKATVIKPQTLQATTVNESTDFALQSTEWKRGITEFVGIRTIHIKDFTNPLDLLKQIASTFELEIRFRIEIMGSFIVGRYVDVIKKVGRDNGKEFLIGKDVQGIRRIENSQDVVTALVGVGPQNSETGEFLTFEEINNGKLYVGNNDALQRWSKDGKHLFDIYSPQTEDQDMTKGRLKQLTEAELKKRINSSTLYEVDAVALEKVFGLSHEAVRKGDTIRIKDTVFSPPLFLEARLIAADECDTDPLKDKYIFGDYREIKDTRSPIDRLYAQIMGSLSNKASKELLDTLDKKLQENVTETEVIRKESAAAMKIAEQVAENLKNNTVDIIEGINPPTENLKDRKTLWQDISKGKPGILKLWKDGKWDPVVPDVESVKKETLEQVSKDIETTKNELNEKVQSVEGKAQEIVKQISDVQKQVNDKVDQTWINTQLKDKADKAGVYTKDEIKDGFIGKQIYETDKQGNVKKFQEISTSFEQTNEAIKSKAEKQSVTDLGNNLSQVSKVANEAKQTADGNVRTILQVDSKVNQTATDFTKKTTAIEETVTGVSTKVTNIQTEQGKLTERITKSEQTADGFIQSIESLTKKDTDISNKLNTVEQTVEGTKKTISDVQQTTNGLSKTTTEIKEQAGKTSEKLESVEKKFDDIKIGGQNFYKQKSFGASGGTSITYDDSNKWWNITIPAGASSSWKGILYNSKNATLLVGRTYTISYEIYADEVIPTAIDINNFGVTTATGTNDNDVVAKRIMRVPKTIAGQWVKVSATFIMPDNITQDFYDNSALGVGGGWTPTKITNIKIRNMQLEEGNIPTSYRTPSEDQVTTDEFTKKTTEIEKSVIGIKETVTKVDNNQSGFDKRVTAVEKTAEGISQNVTKLQETQTTQGKQITEAQSTIKQHSDALNLAVKMKDVEDYVGGIGNQTVLRNVLWKNDTKYWQLTSNAARDTQVTYKGCNSLSVITTGNASSVYKGASHDYINAGPGWNYVFSAYFYTDNKASIDAGAAIELQCYDVNDKMIKNYLQEITISQGTWIRTHVAGLLVEGTKKVKVLFWVRKNGRLWMAQPMLQIGEKPSSFMENPADIAGTDELIEEVGKKVATLDYNQKTTELERLISANAQGISLAAVKTEVYTRQQADGRYADKAYVEKQAGRIDVTEKAITSTVQKGDIISAINQTAEQIQIDVAKLKINADTIVKWLTATGINADVIKIENGKVTIDKNGITAKMADFFFEDERGQKFSVTPRTNLIPDHDFSHISFTTVNNNFLKIEYSPTWTIMSSPYIEKLVVNNYEPMVNPMRIDLGNWIRFTLFEGVKPGKKYTLSAHFRATTNDNRVNITNKPIMRAVFGKYNGDTPVELGRASKTYDAPSIQTGKIVRYALTFIVPSNYVEGNGYVYIDLFGEGLLNNMQAIAVSGVQLVEGDVPSVYNWDTTHGQLVNGTLPFSTIALGTKDNVIYHNHVNKWNYMNAPLEIISNGEMMALVGDDRAGLSFYPRGGGERRSYIGHIYNNENRFRIESKDPVATTQSIECNGINVCGGYFGANAGSIHYTNGSLGLGWYFHDGRWNYVDFTNMTSRT
ncbi:phage tail spike protein [Bacillus toyonensis]|uniref:phage tail spike protein n=1 Tax=Bacillus toyonensis TaxID=155322 RepID=UPI002541EFF6|nr:phage tail spike protein [Bacillus toyonensis]WIG29992.1 phage tail spike protein [Bacillus toyonensis]